MASRWAAWGLGAAVALSACGGKSVDRVDLRNQAGSSHSAGSRNTVGGDTSVSAGGDVSSIAGAPEPSGGLPLSTSEWNVKFHLQLAHPPQSTDAHNCEDLVLTLDLIDQGGTLKAFLGADGNMINTTFVRTRQADSLELPVRFQFGPAKGPCSLASYQFETMTLRAVDSNNDGQSDRLEGSGAGSESFVVFDGMGEQIPMTFTLEGVPDDSAPSVDFGGNARNPLDGLRFEVSEPLSAPKVYLDGPTMVPFFIPQAGDALIELTSDSVLSFGGTWHLAGSAADFAGHPLVTGSALSTVQDPGSFAQDGFEGPLAAILTGGARVIDSSYGIGLPSGSHALLIPPDGSATLHLAKATKGKALTMKFIKLLTDGLADGPTAQIHAAAIGGSQRAESTFTVTGTRTSISIDQWRAASAQIALVVPLIETTSDAIVRFSVFTADAPHYPPTALVIDDLTLD